MLLPLTPSYDATQHELYLRHLHHALTGDGSKLIHNIALTGSYGVGKSSILQQLSEVLKNQAVTISLPTLGKPEPRDVTGDDPAAAGVTNRIQKEIVKQLLYLERPERVPGSRFLRRTRFNWLRGIGYSLLAALPIIVTLYLTHASDRLVRLSGHGLLRHSMVYLGLFAALLVIITALQHLLHNRVRVQQVTAGPASVTLADKTDSYFDEYLDEIVYFFEATKYDIFIFEDLDRFDDPHIFETLRELNTILNTSKQLGDRNIRFIYAIKDSIFEQLGQDEASDAVLADAAEAEVARANRTKFFDLVIPVVPFITHRSARDLMSALMKASGLSVSQELIDLAARHVADMRLIKNIHNEFVVFRERLLLDPGAIPGLEPDQLLAMILYKNVHLSDFELIRTGKSRLDDLYRDSRSLINANIGSLNRRAVELGRIIADPDPLKSRSGQLGERLTDYVERTTRRHRQQYAHSPIDFILDGAPTSQDQLRTSAFWRKFLAPGSTLQVRLRYPGEVSTYTVQTIGEWLDEDLSPDKWKQHDVEAARRELATVEAARNLLGHADMQDLFGRRDFRLDKEGTECSFAQITEQTLESKLAVDLVANGYIDRNFTLYVSQYHGVLVSGQAMNFILHNVQPDIPDLNFRFDSETDIAAVLRECGPVILGGRSAYNIAVLDYLLEQRPADADVVIRRLTAWGSDEQGFVRAYVAGGGQVPALIRRLSGFWPQTLPFVATELEVGEQERVEFFNAAMLGADVAGLSDGNDGVRRYIEKHYQQFAALTDDAEQSAAGDLVELLQFFDVQIAAIAPLKVAIRNGVIERWLYAYTRENLAVALNGDDLSLDVMQAGNEHVYTYTMDDLPAYVTVVLGEPGACSVQSPERFVAILGEVIEHGPSCLGVIVERASSGCRVDDLRMISDAAWPDLARSRRFPLTFTNVSAYVASCDIDEGLAGALIADPAIHGLEDVSEEDRQALAVKVLNARSTISDPAVRVRIVSSLALERYLVAGEVLREGGRLAGLLLAENLVEDSAAVYDAARSADWATKEFLISKSAKFVDYVTPEQLSADDLRQLMRSALIDDALKRSLLARVQSFTTADDRLALQAAAEYAARQRLQVDAGVLLLFTQGGVTSVLIVQLLQPLLSVVPAETLISMLRLMGGEYERLTTVGRHQPKLPNDAAHRALVEVLKASGPASSYREDRGGTMLKVSMRHS